MNKKKKYDIRNEFQYYLDEVEDERIKSYIDKRVIGQIEWYDKKSSKNRYLYKIFMVVSIIMSACIPVLTLTLDIGYGTVIKIIIAILSSGITCISAISTLYNYRELWVQYRTNCEMLKSVLHKFFTRSGEFRGVENKRAYDMLVTSCENYIIKEFEEWGSIKITQTTLDSNVQV